MELKTSEQIKDEVAVANGYESWYDTYSDMISYHEREKLTDEFAKLYTLQIAEAACKEQRELCAENSNMNIFTYKNDHGFNEEDLSLNKDSIINAPQPDIDKLLN